MVQLGHHWGFGLRRAAWRRIQAFLPEWWAELRRVDFQGRNRLRLLRVYRNWDVAVDGVAEDAATELACASLGLARLNIATLIARSGNSREQRGQARFISVFECPRLMRGTGDNRGCGSRRSLVGSAPARQKLSAAHQNAVGSASSPAASPPARIAPDTA